MKFLKLREALPEDLNFILNSWLKSYRTSPVTRDISNSFYFAGEHKKISNILSSAKVQIAADINDPSQILGYIIYDILDGVYVLHWVYVKHTFRKLGIARHLLGTTKGDKVNGIYTYQTKISREKSGQFNLFYNPYATDSGEVSPRSANEVEQGVSHNSEASS